MSDITIRFYTIYNKGIGYAYEARVYGVKKVAKYLAISPKRVSAGVASRTPPLTAAILEEMRAADRAELLGSTIVV